MEILCRIYFLSVLSLTFFSLCARSWTLKELCASALYPEHCVSAFGSLKAENGRDFAASAVKTTLADMQKLTAWASQAASSASATAELADCAELFNTSVRQLSSSLDTLARPTWTRAGAEDVLTWLSATLTNQATCVDRLGAKWQPGFPYSGVQNLSRHVSSALAIVSATTAAPSEPRSRRLLLTLREEDEPAAGGFPAWMTSADRRILQAPAASVPADAVVAHDGTGNFRTLGEALAAAPSKSNGRYIIHVKAGVYSEKIHVEKANIMLVGDGKYATIIKSSQSGGSLKSIATFSVEGNGFIARDIGFENDAGVGAQQSIALLVGGDHSAFFRCSMRSYQDTLYAYTQRQFYRECDIYGTVDFIFGNAAAVFQSCNIFARRPRADVGFITAQGRMDPNQNTGFSIHMCKVTGAPGDPAGANSMYLGRPWKRYSRTVYMQSYLDSIIRAEGWSEWSGSFALSTLYYGEFGNSGPGAGTGSRVTWPGFHVITSPAVASTFTVAQFISGTSWLPGTGVTFVAGLGS